MEGRRKEGVEEGEGSPLLFICGSTPMTVIIVIIKIFNVA